MFGLALLDVAIGLVFTYLILSIACSAFLELWSQARQARGRMLEACLQQLLGNEACVQAFQDQPRILALRQASTGPQAGRRDAPRLRRPAALPGEAFADAVLALHRAPDVQLGAPLEGYVHELLARDAGQPERVRQALAAYYDQSMERLSGHFKRYATRGLVLIGTLVVLLTNTDTFSLANRLYNDANLRDGLMAQAASHVEQREAQAGGALAAGLDKSLALAAAPLFGWDDRARCERLGWLLPASRCPEGYPASAWAWAGGVLTWLFGVFLTVMAIAMGADFWFTSLQKLLAARNVLRKQEGATDQASEPAQALLPGTPAAPALPADALHTGWRGFRPSATAFSLISAYWLARAAELAYETDRDAVRAQAEAWGLRVEFIAIAASSTEACLFQGAEFMVLAFRGTQETADFLSDARYAQVDWPVAAGMRVHSGFHAALDAAWPALLAALARARARARAGGELAPALWLTGHSLGAALATLAAVRIAREAPAHRRQILGLYTFGSPRCGDPGFAEGAERLCRDRVFRFINHRDAVTRVPPRACPGVEHPYEHVGMPLYFDSRGLLQRDPGFWYRFLDTALPGTDLAEGGREALKAQLADAFADHGMACYRRLLEQQAELRALLRD